MKTTVELRQLQAQKRAEGFNIVELAETEKRELTVDENTTLRAIQTEVEAFDTQIKDAELREKFAKEKIANNPTPVNTGVDAEKREMGNFSIAKVMKAMVSGDKVDGFEREILQDSQIEAREYGLKVSNNYIGHKVLDAVQLRAIEKNPMLRAMLEKRAMSAGSSTAGGNFIQTDKVGFFDVLRANRVLDKVGANWQTGLNANIDYRGFSTGWAFGAATETATAADADAVTVNRSISPKRVAGKIYVSNQLMIQDPNIDANLLSSLQAALYPYIEQLCLIGTGSSGQPTGITGNSTAATVALGTNGGAPSLTYVQNMKKTLKNGNVDQTKMFWLINPNTEALLQATPIDTGSGAMLVPYGTYFGGVDGYIGNIPYMVTSNLPNNLTKGSASGTCSAVILGDFSNLMVGQFGGLDLIVDHVTLAESGQTKIVANSYWDTTILRSGTIIKTLDLITG
jgi:HK97 family phage major capsid protein